MENLKIRDAARFANVPLWMVAERYGITDSSFSRKLRRELPAEEQSKLLQIIDELAKERTA